MAVRVFRNPRIYTGLDETPTVQAVAVEGERIVATGTEEAVRTALNERGVDPAGAEIVDLDGECVVPGFYDAHIHTGLLSQGLLAVDLRGCADLEEALGRVKAFADDLTDEDAWITGGRWDCNRWAVPKQPTRQDLDRVCPDHPVALPSVDGHTTWANSRALQMAGIDRDTPNPDGGEIVKDEHGEPTGILREAAAWSLRRMSMKTDPATLAVALDVGQQQLLSQGITSVMDLDGEDVRAAYQLLKDDGRLHIRVHKGIPMDALDLAIEEGRRTGDGDDWLRTGPVKLFSDGALGSLTCLMCEPFAGTNNSGMAVTGFDDMLRMVQQASAAGIAVATHAIGDRAAQIVVDAYEQGDRSGGTLRHRVEHAQYLRWEDVHRMARLGVVASMQPTHCTTDIDLTDKLLGDRDLAAYAWRSCLNIGTPLAFGSDAPVEDINPFEGLHAAITRQRGDGTPPGGWQPHECLTPLEALRAYTLGSAFAAGEEDDKGVLAPGKLADLVAVDTDITADPMAVRGAQALTTVVGGAVKWQR